MYLVTKIRTSKITMGARVRLAKPAPVRGAVDAALERGEQFFSLPVAAEQQRWKEKKKRERQRAIEATVWVLPSHSMF